MEIFSGSNFNNFCHYVVTELKIKFPKIKRVFYSCKNEKCIFEKDRESLEKGFYISTKKPVKFCAYEQEVEHKTKFISGRASYIERNKAMILDSDFCVFYYDETYKPELRKISKNSIGYYQPKSGTAIAYNFAKQKKKTIINVAR